MKSILIIAGLVICAVAVNAKLKSGGGAATIPEEWLDMSKGCISEARRQVQAEIAASVQYLAMGAYFSQDVVNLPGFAEFFFKAAGEEREHATKLIEYLLMRTDVQNVRDLIKVPVPSKTRWDSGVEALEDALRTEASVTKSIKQVIQKCEDDDKKNDYHLVDYLTGEFLDEQYKGQRELAGKISTLKKMMKVSPSSPNNVNNNLAEFLFDKQMNK